LEKRQELPSLSERKKSKRGEKKPFHHEKGEEAFAPKGKKEGGGHVGEILPKEGEKRRQERREIQYLPRKEK